MPKMKIAVLISGGGTNLQAIIDAIKSKELDAEIAVVISNRKNAYGLVRAKNENIDAIYLNAAEFSSAEEYDEKILEILSEKNIDLIVLAGYLKILTEKLISKYENRIINIHPSLIPSFCGDGYYGIKVHEAVLNYGAKISGATTHFVTKATDGGPIIMQKSADISEIETAEELQKRILKIEHEILIKSIKAFCEGRIKLEGRKVKIEE